MRRLLLALCLLALPTLAQAQTFIQRCSSGDAGSSTCASTAFATLTAGATVVVTVRVPNTTDTVTGITGCGSGWARLFSRVSASERNETWYALNLGAIACAPVPTWSGVDPGARMSGAEFSGVATASAFDVSSVSSGSGTAFSSGATATLAQAANLAVASCADNDYMSVALGSIGTFSFAHPPGGTESNRIFIAYKVTAATTAVTFTATADNSMNWACGVGILKSAGGGGGGTIQTGPVLFPLLGVGQ
jgi:hypothetical protein